MTDTVDATINAWTRSATPGLWSHLGAAILRRAAVIALGLGSILTLANQAEAIFGAGKLQLLPLVLVYVTPFVVVTVSQLLGIQRAILDARREGRNNPTDEPFALTALTHGIPSRALRLGLLVGSLNASLVTTVAFLGSGNLGAVSSALLGQAFSLPVLFGVLSQAIAYRRASRRLQTQFVKGGGQ